MIYEALREYFAAGGLDVQEHPEHGWVATDGFGRHGSWLLVGQAHEEREQAAVYCVLPERVPEGRRAAVNELLARINYGLILGNFEIDLSDGEVRFKVSADFTGSGPTAERLKPLVATALAQFDRWLPSLRAVAAGEDDPAAAFARGVAAEAAAAPASAGRRRALSNAAAPASASRRRAISIAAASDVAPVASAC